MKLLISSICFSTLLIISYTSEGANKAGNETNCATVTTKYISVEAAVKVSPLKDILSTYLQLKNAFAKDNDAAAAVAGNAMVKAFAAFDKKSLTAAQAKTYMNIEAGAKENAEHIGKNAGNIKHQREHFESLSKQVYALVKLLGAGQKLYYDNCPMYNNNKGAQWLSENKIIANPYLGKSMSECGSVIEELN